MELNANLMEIVPEKNANQPPQPPKEEILNASSAVENSVKPVLNIAKKLIKNGKMNIAVSKISDAKKEVEKILKKNDAYTQNETFQNSDTSEDLSLIIRIPSQNFDAVINSFSSGIESVEFKSIKADDLTQEYIEISIRLANKKNISKNTEICLKMLLRQKICSKFRKTSGVWKMK